MRVGVNALFLRPGVVGGTESYVAGLLPALLDHPDVEALVVFVGPTARDWPLPRDPRVTRVVCELAGPGVARRYVAEHLLLPVLARRWRVDVLHSMGYTGPAIPLVPAVVSVHDLNYRALGHLMSGIRRRALETVVPVAMRSAARVLVLSEASRAQIARAYPWAVEKLRVIPIAARPRGDVVVGQPATPPYLVAFSSQSSHKNIERLIRVWGDLTAAGQVRERLVLVGHRPTPASVTMDVSDANDSVHFTGWLSDEAVRTTLAGATGLVFPSLYEGFGLPVLEAMEVGVPVISSNAAALPEVGGSAALYFDPNDDASLREALSRFLSDPALRATLRANGLVNAARFSWAQAADATVSAYREAIDAAR